MKPYTDFATLTVEDVQFANFIYDQQIMIMHCLTEVIRHVGEYGVPNESIETVRDDVLRVYRQLRSFEFEDYNRLKIDFDLLSNQVFTVGHYSFSSAFDMARFVGRQFYILVSLALSIPFENDEWHSMNTRNLEWFDNRPACDERTLQLAFEHGSLNFTEHLTVFTEWLGIKESPRREVERVFTSIVKEQKFLHCELFKYGHEIKHRKFRSIKDIPRKSIEESVPRYSPTEISRECNWIETDTDRPSSVWYAVLSKAETEGELRKRVKKPGRTKKSDFYTVIEAKYILAVGMKLSPNEHVKSFIDRLNAGVFELRGKPTEFRRFVD